MKRFSLYCAVVVFTAMLTSCSDATNPAASNAQNEPAITNPVSNVSLIELPASATPNPFSKVSDVKFLVTPADGGKITVSDSYETLTGSKVSIDMTLDFPAGAVSSNTYMSVSLDSRFLIADFSPSHTQFAKPAVLSVKVSGLDLSKVTSNVNLFYIDGIAFESIDGPVTTDKAAGTLTYTGELTHFSLYGFGFTR